MKKKANHKHPPLFISFEGGEGAGKTTLIDGIEQELRNQGFDVVKTREPGGTLLGEHVRQLLLDAKSTIPVGSNAELLLFLAARAQHIEEVIHPALEKGKIVLCDRFNDSTVAYQGAARGLGVERVHTLCSLVCGDVVPSLTLYLDVDPKIGLSRAKQVVKEFADAGEADRIESQKISFHQKVRKAFLDMAKNEPERFHCIDANQPIAKVLQEALKIIQKRIGYV